MNSNTALPGSANGDLAALVLDSLNAGVYVTNLERRIVYWNKAAQRLTGWRPQEILGRACHDQVLCHVDKDNRPLCGKEFCPLHRAITTGTPSEVPIVVFALSAEGKRIPMRVSVAPLRSSDGSIIGGVETFLEMASEVDDLQRAQRIQLCGLINEAAGDPRLLARMHYAPMDVIGGDFCAVSRAPGDRYAFILADVMGHGLSAALYTMYLRRLWDEQSHLPTPAAILSAINRGIAAVMSASGAFATAICGTLDPGGGALLLASAGGPAPLLFDTAGGAASIELSGVPIGVLEENTFEQIERELAPGERLLLFSDGVVELRDGRGECIETPGLLGLLRELHYPDQPLDWAVLEDRLLTYTARIRFADDLTLLEISR